VPITARRIKFGGSNTIAVEDDSSGPEEGVLALLYAAGGRPTIEDLRRASEASGAFSITFDSGDLPGSAEVLITGLAFEVAGLIPAEPEPVPPIAHRYGLDGAWSGQVMEALIVRPDAHLAGAAAMLPVVRGCSALASSIAGQTGAAAVVWIPARSAMSTAYFSAVIADWLGGGAFPALGLTALVRGPSEIRSEGLSFFTGQELEVVAPPGSDPGSSGRVAVRMVDLLVKQGRLSTVTRLTGPDRQPLLAEPLDDGRRVRVCVSE